jgi:uncharacterized protein YkwD
VALAGCGGGGSKPAAQAPSTQATGNGGIVSAERTLGLVGPAGRATKTKQSFSDRTSRISPDANHKTRALTHGVAGGAACDNGGLMPSGDNIDQLNAAVLCLVNAERADNGLPALQPSAQLEQAARGMAGRMVAEQFFSHDTPDGKSVVDRIEPTGYIPRSGDWVVGENLAWGSGGLSTPQAIVNGWMNSPGHRANILAPDYKDIGLAAAMGSPTPSQSGGAVYVNNFGARSGADLNAVLPVTHRGSNANQASKAQKVAAKRKAANRKKHKKRKHRRHPRRH